MATMKRRFPWGTVLTDETGRRYLYVGTDWPRHKAVYVEEGVVTYQRILDEQLGSMYWPLEAEAERDEAVRELGEVRRERDALAATLRAACDHWPKVAPKLRSMYREALA